MVQPEYYLRTYTGHYTAFLAAQNKRRRVRKKPSMPTYIREVELRYKKRYVKNDAPIGEPLVNPEMVYQLFSDLQNEVKEKVITISVDKYAKILCFEVVAIGSTESVYLKPIEVLWAAIPLNPAAQPPRRRPNPQPSG